MANHLLPGHLYGKTLQSRKVTSFELTERVYPPLYRTPKHSHKQALFCFVMQGDYTEVYGPHTRECVPSTLLFHPAEECHAEYFHDGGGRSFVIEIEQAWLARWREQLDVLNAPAEFHGGVPELLVRRLYKEFAQWDAASPLIIEGLMLEMLGEAARQCAQEKNTPAPAWLQQARELLRTRFAESLTLQEIAQTVAVHPVHLAQTFRRTFDCTVGDYIRQLRIEYACHELAADAKPIVDIALAAGFCDQSHFTRTFKRATGVAPSQYREALRAR
jgi:AraC family transcriptional regulator